MLTYSIIITIVLYVLISYLSYVTASILYNGLRYNLPLSVIRSFIFIGVSYISIISDVVMFGYTLYSSILVKNGMLLVLILSTLIPACDRKEKTYEHKGE